MISHETLSLFAPPLPFFSLCSSKCPFAQRNTLLPLILPWGQNLPLDQWTLYMSGVVDSSHSQTHVFHQQQHLPAEMTKKMI